MKELILGVIAFIFATVYNIIVFILNLECADGKFVDEALFLMTLNVMKDAVVLAAILYNIFLKWLEGGDKMEEQVNHPSHYQQGIEPIEVIESWDLNFNLGNVIKYTLRAPYKENMIQDLEKAKWYLEREIIRLKKEETKAFLRGED